MKILIIQQKMIGDVLTSSILFEALRKKYPGAQLDYLIHPHTTPVVDNNPNIDNLVLFDPLNQKSFFDLLNFSGEIKKQEYDVVIDVYAKINTALITAFSGAEKKISNFKWYTSKAYTHTFELKKELQTNAGFAIENRMLLLQGISEDFPVELKPKIYLTRAEIAAARSKLVEAGISLEEPLVMVGILGSSIKKTYPPQYMAAVLDQIIAHSKPLLLFNYIPKQQEQAKEIFKLCKPETRKKIFFDFYGKSLREFMAITSLCNALIGNEGGAVNMAKALDIPTFSIFSPQIKKENWSIYEDGEDHVSVHLADYNPQIIEGVSKKTLSKNSEQFYALLKPNLIFAKLESFLNRHLNLKASSNIKDS